MRRSTLISIHKWIGLVAGLWLVVLGASGLMLDHRDDWAWAWQVMVPDSWLPDATAKKLEMRHLTLAQAHPDDSARWVVAGASGAWVTTDAGAHWLLVTFRGRDAAPMIYGMVPDVAKGWEQLWMATSDGLWALEPGESGTEAQPRGLQGLRLTAIDLGAESDELVLVENRTDLILWNPATGSLGRIETSEARVSGLPEQVSWSRFIFDLHLGRALLDRPLSMLINDIGAVLFMLLPLTGFLYWYLPRRWRGKGGMRKGIRLAGFRWLYRVHASVLGLLALIPLLYLALTGIVMDHRNELIPTLAKNKISRDVLPPVYDFNSLALEISHVIAYPGEPERLTVGTRLGVLSTDNSGESWQRELGMPVAPGYVWSLKRIGNQLFLGGLGGPSYYRPVESNTWTMVPGLFGMPSDATVSEDAWYVISGPAMKTGDLESGLVDFNLPFPTLDTTPLMLIMFEVHNGGLIHESLVWGLDLVAIGIVLMLITGPILWWRRKW